MATKTAKGVKAPEGRVFVREDSLEAMADNIQSISKAVQQFYGPGKLNKHALILLIREGTRFFGNVVAEKDVEKVLNSLTALEKRFVTPKS